MLTILATGVVFYIQYIEHWRSRNPNGVVLFYWLLLIIALAVKLQSLLAQGIQHKHLAYFITFCTGFGLAVIEFVLEYFIPKKLSAYDALGDEYECPYEYADVFSKMMLGEEIDEDIMDELGDVAALQGVSKFPARIKCATLAWKAMEKGVHNEEK